MRTHYFILLIVLLVHSTVVSGQCPNSNICETNKISFQTDGTWNRTNGNTYVVTPGGGWNLTNLTNVSWISPQPNTGIGGIGPGSFEFTKTFCVCKAGDFNISGFINADNQGQLEIDGNIIISSGTSNDWAVVDAFNQTMNLPAGQHTIRLILINWSATGTATGPTSTGIAVTGNIESTGPGRLCCQGTPDVTGKKYFDINNNGVIDPNIDPVLSGWNFTMTGTNNVVYTGTTNTNGEFVFSGVLSGSYTLIETIPTGWNVISPAGGSTTIEVTEGENYTRDFLNNKEPVEPRSCCEESSNDNLIVNGSFESGNLGFTSGYNYQPLIAKGSVKEGLYSIVNKSTASSVSSCWNTTDHTYCSDNDGYFMVVNGRTHTQQLSLLYQQSNISVEQGKEYIFCMYYKHLSQCEFDVFDPLDLDIQVVGATIVGQGCDDNDNHCGWTKISYSIVPTGGNISVDVLLDESGLGDGNDLAFDDISLREKVEANGCDYTFAITAVGPNRNITASTSVLPTGSTAEWVVSEVDCITEAVLPGTTMTYTSNATTFNFPGYCCNSTLSSAGVFIDGHCYKIERIVSSDSCCIAPCKESKIIHPDLLYAMVASSTDGSNSSDGRHSQQQDGRNDLNKRFITNNDIRVFPNPGDGFVTLRSSRSLVGTTLKVYNMNGKMLLEQKLKSTQTDIDISKLPSAIYNFELIKADGTTIHKKYTKH